MPPLAQGLEDLVGADAVARAFRDRTGRSHDRDRHVEEAFAGGVGVGRQHPLNLGAELGVALTRLGQQDLTSVGLAPHGLVEYGADLLIAFRSHHSCGIPPARPQKTAKKNLGTASSQVMTGEGRRWRPLFGASQGPGHAARQRQARALQDAR